MGEGGLRANKPSLVPGRFAAIAERQGVTSEPSPFAHRRHSTTPTLFCAWGKRSGCQFAEQRPETGNLFAKRVEPGFGLPDFHAHDRTDDHHVATGGNIKELAKALRN